MSTESWEVLRDDLELVREEVGVHRKEDDISHVVDCRSWYVEGSLRSLSPLVHSTKKQAAQVPSGDSSHSSPLPPQ